MTAATLTTRKRGSATPFLERRRAVASRVALFGRRSASSLATVHPIRTALQDRICKARNLNQQESTE
jgi:hypothetical protein